jgi:hypothetical protein
MRYKQNPEDISIQDIKLYGPFKGDRLARRRQKFLVAFIKGQEGNKDINSEDIQKATKELKKIRKIRNGLIEKKHDKILNGILIGEGILLAAFIYNLHKNIEETILAIDSFQKSQNYSEGVDAITKCSKFIYTLLISTYIGFAGILGIMFNQLTRSIEKWKNKWAEKNL